MAVNVIWSLTNGGDAISTNLDYGLTLSNGQTGSSQTLYLRHDGTNPITDVGLFVRQYSATYTGDATAATDFSELLAWGDGSASEDFGGLQINQDATGGFPSGSWPAFPDSDIGEGSTFRTGVGDSELNAISLSTATGATAAETLQVGSTPNVRFATRIKVPTSEDTTGIRQWDLVIKYTFTS